jgi:aspartate racemase
MKRIGILGGMSWESSVEYERIINHEVRRRLGGSHSADLIVRSYDFATIEALQEAADWEAAGRLLADDAAMLQQAGAELILLATNTMHRLASQIEAATTVPFLHIADATAAAVRDSGEIRQVALLATRYTMEQDFYRGRLRDRHGLDVVIPPEPRRSEVHRIIYEELVRGVVTPSSKAAMIDIASELVEQGASSVIAGCTEIELLLQEDDLTVPYFPSTRIHALAAVEAALSATSTIGTETENTAPPDSPGRAEMDPPA